LSTTLAVLGRAAPTSRRRRSSRRLGRSPAGGGGRSRSGSSRRSRRRATRSAKLALDECKRGLAILLAISLVDVGICNMLG